ncbi:hypothetical protein Nepgr_005079 [Nepenthes gracilis]|uniref:Sucrose-phosphatase n=1 Tax=Nepenthes gracilis TaxID=150966 RepID=A0AAD3XFZ9_NEPGR|nr:hypothetical protein Nepgr_005079 [Nepenthes gracilis]
MPFCKTKKAPRNLDPILIPFYHLKPFNSHSKLLPSTFRLGGVKEQFMDRLNASARLMIVSDLDHTMVDHHDSENLSLLRFNALWEANYRHDSLLVFSTGRSPTLYKQLRKEKPLLTPDITIMSVGTEITYGKSMVPDEGWVEYLNQRWNKSIVVEETGKFPELTPQSETEQRPHKVSFYIQKDKAQEVMKVLAEKLEKRGLDIKIIYSGGIDLDILPQGAGKGQALAYLLKKFKSEGKQPTNTLVCGDSGNDADLFSIPEVHGVMVSNAQEELLQWHAEHAKDNPKVIHASERCAAGIIQAIGHFGLGSSVSPRNVTNFTGCEMENFNPNHEIVKFYLFFERWRRAEVDSSAAYCASIEAVCHPSGVFIHPSGAELSLHDCIKSLRKCYGDRQGTNYRVWVDRVLPTRISSGAWLVRFDRWELSGEERRCCVVTTLFASKDAKAVGGFSCEHVHQTWLDGHAASDHSAWLV